MTNLDQTFFDALEEGIAALSAMDGEILDRLDTSLTGMLAAIEALGGALDDATQRASEDADGLSDALASLERSASEATLDEAPASDAWDTLDEAMRDDGRALEGAVSHGAGALDALARTARDLARDEDRSADGVARAGASLGHTIDTDASALVRAHHDARDDAATFAEDLGGAWSRERDALFDGMTGTLAEAITVGLDGAMGDLAERVSEAFSGLAELATAHGEAWGDASAHALEEAATHVGQTCAHEIEGAVASLVREGVERLAEEIVEQAGILAAGASVTTAMVPILPEIAAAKAGLALINGVLDAF